MLHSPLPQSIAPAEVRLSELVASFSYALDLTEAERGDLYYTLLLKDLGCSSNAARICELYEADDLAFKRGYKTVGTSLAATLLFVVRKSASGKSLQRR